MHETDISYTRDSREYGEDCVETAKSSSGSNFKLQKRARKSKVFTGGTTCHLNSHSALTVVYKLYVTVFVQYLRESVTAIVE